MKLVLLLLFVLSLLDHGTPEKDSCAGERNCSNAEWKTATGKPTARIPPATAKNSHEDGKLVAERHASRPQTIAFKRTTFPNQLLTGRIYERDTEKGIYGSYKASDIGTGRIKEEGDLANVESAQTKAKYQKSIAKLKIKSHEVKLLEQRVEIDEETLRLNPELKNIEELQTMNLELVETTMPDLWRLTRQLFQKVIENGGGAGLRDTFETSEEKLGRTNLKSGLARSVRTKNESKMHSGAKTTASSESGEEEVSEPRGQSYKPSAVNDHSVRSMHPEQQNEVEGKAAIVKQNPTSAVRFTLADQYKHAKKKLEQYMRSRVYRKKKKLSSLDVNKMKMKQRLKNNVAESLKGKKSEEQTEHNMMVNMRKEDNRKLDEIIKQIKVTQTELEQANHEYISFKNKPLSPEKFKLYEQYRQKKIAVKRAKARKQAEFEQRRRERKGLSQRQIAILKVRDRQNEVTMMARRKWKQQQMLKLESILGGRTGLKREHLTSKPEKWKDGGATPWISMGRDYVVKERLLKELQSEGMRQDHLDAARRILRNADIKEFPPQTLRVHNARISRVIANLQLNSHMVNKELGGAEESRLTREIDKRKTEITKEFYRRCVRDMPHV